MAQSVTLNFLRKVPAHILGEMGIISKDLFSVYFHDMRTNIK